MKKAIIIALIGIGVTGLVITKLVSHSTPAAKDSMRDMPQQTESAKPAGDNSVTIQNYKFSPSPLRIKKGTTVTWTNTDTAKHNVVVDEGQPSGGPSGPLFGKNETYQFTFASVGTYKYHCEPHPYMHGVVEVTE